MPLENIVAEKIDLFMPCCHSVLPVVWIMASKTMCQVMKSINQCKPKKPCSFRNIWLYQIFPYRVSSQCQNINCINHCIWKRKLLSITLACNEWILTWVFEWDHCENLSDMISMFFLQIVEIKTALILIQSVPLLTEGQGGKIPSFYWKNDMMTRAGVSEYLSKIWRY